MHAAVLDYINCEQLTSFANVICIFNYILRNNIFSLMDSVDQRLAPGWLMRRSFVQFLVVTGKKIFLKCSFILHKKRYSSRVNFIINIKYITISHHYPIIRHATGQRSSPKRKSLGHTPPVSLVLVRGFTHFSRVLNLLRHAGACFTVSWRYCC